MSTLPISPAPAELELLFLSTDELGIVVHMRTKRPAVLCPGCKERTDRVHSRYVRILRDLPWHGTPVRVRLLSRRFFCRTAGCQRRIFVERIPSTATPYARRTLRLASVLESIALALGGEGGERLVIVLGMHASADTLLRCIRSGASTAVAQIPQAPLRIVGIDDWAWKKGHRYGTIMVDLERGRVVDLLPNRNADSVASWLAARPGVEVVTRDRSKLYADGASRGAPGAVQVADRWHLVKNLTDSVERVLWSRRGQLKQAADTIAPPPPVPPPPPPSVPLPQRGATQAERAKEARRERRLERYNEVVALYGRGVPKRTIARDLGLSRQTVHHWIRAGSFPERKERVAAPSILDDFRPHIEKRVRDGLRNAAEITRELRRVGYRGGTTIVRNYVRTLLSGETGTRPAGARAPSVRKSAWLLGVKDCDLPEDDRAYVTALATVSGELADIRNLACEFRRVLKDRDPPGFDLWLEAAEESPLRHFAVSLRTDLAAVRAAVELPWSNGPVEGQANRLKLAKRQMYGRGGFDLLRARVLHAA